MAKWRAVLVRHFWFCEKTCENRDIMKCTFLGFIVIFVFVPSFVAQPSRVPVYSQYPSVISRSKPKRPSLSSHKNARLFRTNLRNAAKKGVNFAGNYALTYWGCGASCGVGAIINLRTGNVYFPKQLDGIWALGWPENDAPFGYRKNSRLLILNGYLPGDYNGSRVTYGFHYFVWNGTSLRRVKFVPRDWRVSE